MSENNSTDDVRHVKAFRVVPGEVYLKADIDEMMKPSNYTWSVWHKRGLRKLNTNTEEAYYLGEELIECWKKRT